MARLIRYDEDGKQIDAEPLDRAVGESHRDDERELAAWRDFAARWCRSYYRAPSEEETAWYEELQDELDALIEECDIQSVHRG